MSRSSRINLSAGRSGSEVARWMWLTRFGFVLTVALVIARAMLLEIIREPVEAVPGAESIPRGPGPAATLVLNLLCCIPALLVLARAVLERTYRLRGSWSFVPLALLGVWTMLSPFWAADKFAAIIGASTLACSFVLLWSTAQIIRSWLALRVVAAACFGLLLVMLAHGLIYRYVDVPEMKRSWEQHREQILRERGWEENSFSAQQFEVKVTGGEIMGFSASPNTYAAAIVLLTVILIGIAVQRIIDHDEPPWIVAAVAGFALSCFVLYTTESRAAKATPILAMGMFGVLALMRNWLTSHRRIIYIASAVVIVLGLAAAIGHGVYHGSLPGDSLTFRWRYWIASMRIFEQYPLLGVGWSNFGPHYMAVRLPIASEEIKDPHNFLMRFLVESGIGGLVLVVAWLAMYWWSATKPNEDSAESNPGAATWLTTQQSLTWLALLAGLGILLNIILSIDFAHNPWFVILEILKRLLYFLLLMLGMSLASLQTLNNPRLDDRPAKWIRRGLLTGLGVFLIHNLIDFSMFENSATYLFVLVAGSVLGMQLKDSPRLSRRGVTIVGLCAGIVLWLGAAAFLAFPVAYAEERARAGDEEIRNERFVDAYRGLKHAFEIVPINGDYAFRAARAAMYAQAPARDVRQLLDEAIEVDPLNAKLYLARATFNTMIEPVNETEVFDDYMRALQLNPNDVAVRLMFADLLTKYGKPDAARHQYLLALDYNEKLHPDEPKRLTAERIAAVNEKLRALNAQ